MSKKNVSLQPGRDGRHGKIEVHPGIVISHQSHNDSAVAPAKGGNIARDSTRGKNVQAVPVAAGMHQTVGTNIGAPVTTMLSSIPDASSPLAADPTRLGKMFAPVAAVPGQRSRTTDAAGPAGIGENHERGKGRYADHIALGQRIIGEALSAAEPDHPAKLGLTPTVKIGK